MDPTCSNRGPLRSILKSSAEDGTPPQPGGEANATYAMPPAFHKLGECAPAPPLPWKVRREKITIGDKFHIINTKIDGTKRIDSVRIKKIPNTVNTNFAEATADPVTTNSEEATAQQGQEKTKRVTTKSVQFKDHSYVAYDDETRPGENHAYHPTLYATIETKKDEPGYYRQNCLPDITICHAEEDTKEENEEEKLGPSKVFSSESTLRQSSSQNFEQVTKSGNIEGTDCNGTETQLRRLYDTAKEVDDHFYSMLHQKDQTNQIAVKFLQDVDDQLIKEHIKPIYVSAHELLNDRKNITNTFDALQASQTTKVNITDYEVLIASIEDAIRYRSNSDISDLTLHIAEFSIVAGGKKDQEFVQSGIESLTAIVEGRKRLLEWHSQRDQGAGFRTA